MGGDHRAVSYSETRTELILPGKVYWHKIEGQFETKTHTCKFAGLYKNTIRATDQRTGLTSK